MTDEAGKNTSRCIMIVTCVDKNTQRAMDWPADATSLFIEDETAEAVPSK
jgi:acyl-CoA thioester hydrolase